ncbi:MAG: AAA family ATPase [Candidatus Jordarchaeaceae archaeon]
MLKRLEVRNYKSLKEVDVQLERFNVLVGPNASGKSNFIDCLAFLSETLQDSRDLAAILGKRGGFQKIIFQGEEEIVLVATFQDENRESKYYIKCR